MRVFKLSKLLIDSVLFEYRVPPWMHNFSRVRVIKLIYVHNLPFKSTLTHTMHMCSVQTMSILKCAIAVNQPIHLMYIPHLALRLFIFFIIQLPFKPVDNPKSNATYSGADIK